MDIYEHFFNQIDLTLDQMTKEEWTAEEIKWYLLGVIDTIKSITRTECSTVKHLRELKEQEHDYQNYLNFVHSLRPAEEK